MIINGVTSLVYEISTQATIAPVCKLFGLHVWSSILLKDMKKTIARILQENIKSLREKKGLSQNELAEKAGLSRIHVARIESFARCPSVDALQCIADALGVDSYEILVGDNYQTLISGQAKRNEILDEVVKSIEELKG